MKKMNVPFTSVSVEPETQRMRDILANGDIWVMMEVSATSEKLL